MAALCGAVAPRAAATPSAARIDAFLTAHDSPMAGTGATFVAEGERNGVDPAFLVAIAGAETSFGQFIYSSNGDQCTFNAFNWFYGPSWPQSDFSSWDEGIAAVAAGIAGDLYYGSGLVSVQSIAPKYCPIGTENWVSNVTAFMTELGGDPFDTRFGALDAVSDAAPTVAPSLPVLAGDATLDSDTYFPGDTAGVRFTVANGGDLPLTVGELTLVIRGPGAIELRFAAATTLILQGGESRDVCAAWQLSAPGRWRGWVQAKADDGKTISVGPRPAFAFRVSKSAALGQRRWYSYRLALGRAL